MFLKSYESSTLEVKVQEELNQIQTKENVDIALIPHQYALKSESSVPKIPIVHDHKKKYQKLQPVLKEMGRVSSLPPPSYKNLQSTAGADALYA